MSWAGVAFGGLILVALGIGAYFTWKYGQLRNNLDETRAENDFLTKMNALKDKELAKYGADAKAFLGRLDAAGTPDQLNKLYQEATGQVPHPDTK